MKGDFPIQEAILPRSGPRLDIGFRHEEGVVAEFECREAALFANYNWTEFLALSWREKAATVAHYRLHNLIEAHRIAAAAPQ